MRALPPLLSSSFNYRKLCLATTSQALKSNLLLVALLVGSLQAGWAQAGKQGAKVVATTGTILNEYVALAADAPLGSTSLSIAKAANGTLLNGNTRFGGTLDGGDLLLIYQPQGATMSTADNGNYGSLSALGSAGRYQLVQVAAAPTIASSGASTVQLSCPLYAGFTTAGHAQVIRVPRYTTLTLSASASPAPSITGQAWNGSTGGVVVAEVQGDVALNSGSLTVSGLGFRGGVVKQTTDASNNQNYAYVSASTTYGGAKGESIVGYTAEYDALTGRYGRGAPANGGGGGNSHNGGGGGGANAAAPSGPAYTGTGNPDATYAATWNLESSNFGSSTSSGGGRGGYSYASGNADPTVSGPGAAAWGGDYRRVKGGLGGHPVNSPGRAFFGGGGGAGDSNDGTGTSGAAGGGFLYLVSGGTVSGGSLLANGSDVVGYSSGTTGSRNDGPGGAGGGGSIVVQAAGGTSGAALTANGGTGGNQTYPAATVECEGPGGGGGGGYLAYEVAGTGPAPTASVLGGASGVSNATPVATAFPPNGATRGGAGLAETGSCATTSLTALNSLNNNPTACTAVADVSTTVSFSNNPQPVRQPVTITATFRNAGPGAAAGVVRLVQLPAGLTGPVTVSTGQGTGSYDAGSGQVTFDAPVTIASGSSTADATITYTPQQTGSVTVSSTVATTTNQACQTGNDASGSATLVIQPVADLSLALSANKTSVVIDATTANTLTYTALVTNQTTSANASGAAATGVVLTIQLPKALLSPVLPASTDASYSPTTGLLTLTVGTVNLNSSVSYPFTFTLSPNNQRTDTNGAQVVATGAVTENELDPNPADNTNQQVITPVSLPAGACTGTGADGRAATQGLYGEYYKGYFADDLTYFDASKRSPNLTRTDARAAYATTNGWGDVTGASSGGTATNPDYFSARLRGSLTITKGGSYTFRTSSDDASYVWVGDAARATTLDAAKTVVKDGTPHGVRNTDGAAVNLDAGTYPILILYGENAGDNALTISYSGPDTNNAMAVLPQAALCTLGYAPLPVTLTSFTATAEGSNTARLRWTTASELNSSHFEVERSADGTIFSRIGTVAAAGSTLVAQAYTFLDALAAPTAGGPVYYRLRQVDTDGTAAYSPTRTVMMGAAGLALYPNPARHLATLSGAPAGALVQVLDVLGRLVLATRADATGTAALALPANLPAGLYLVHSGAGMVSRLTVE